MSLTECKGKLKYVFSESFAKATFGFSNVLFFYIFYIQSYK